MHIYFHEGHGSFGKIIEMQDQLKKLLKKKVSIQSGELNNDPSCSIFLNEVHRDQILIYGDESNTQN